MRLRDKGVSVRKTVVGIIKDVLLCQPDHPRYRYEGEREREREGGRERGKRERQRGKEGERGRVRRERERVRRGGECEGVGG